MPTTPLPLHRPRPLTVAALAAALLAGSAVAVPSAIADQVTPIGHDQAFVGQTEGPMGTDTILLVCPGPASVGHPAGGQSVEVLPASSTAKAGFTGSKADHIVVSFPTSSTAAPITLQAYGVPAPIPTTLTLPCGGHGIVRFAPAPTSKTARPDLVQVAFDPGPGAK